MYFWSDTEIKQRHSPLLTSSSASQHVVSMTEGYTCWCKMTTPWRVEFFSDQFSQTWIDHSFVCQKWGRTETISEMKSDQSQAVSWLLYVWIHLLMLCVCCILQSCLEAKRVSLLCVTRAHWAKHKMQLKFTNTLNGTGCTECISSLFFKHEWN